MDYSLKSLELCEKNRGKLRVESAVEIDTREQLSAAYTPGVAEPCRKIHKNPEDIYKYTIKSHTIAVVTDGTAVLGLGDIGPGAGLPVREGDPALHKIQRYRRDSEDGKADRPGVRRHQS